MMLDEFHSNRFFCGPEFGRNFEPIQPVFEARKAGISVSVIKNGQHAKAEIETFRAGSLRKP